MMESVVMHFRRRGDLERETARLHSALRAMNDSKSDLDAAIEERVQADPFGDFAKAARESRF